MKRLLLLLIVFGALPLFGQGTSFPVFNRQGWTMAGAVVGTCTGPADPGTGTLYCTAPVTTYQDWTLTTPCTNQTTIPNPPGPPLGPTHGAGCTNPGLTDSHGNATIFAANGFYWALISGYQVVPQTFPFDIGAGGGGGGPCPFGALYDIQINDPLGLCGADSGIGLLNPTVHTLYENILNANQQVDVSDATNSGLICQGHSTGSAVDSAFCTEPSTTFSPTPTGGYGLFPPDNAPTTLHQAIRVASLTPTNVVTKYGTIPFYPTEFSTTGAGVSLEYLYPLDSTNAPSPTTSSDLVRTLFPQYTSTRFRGPYPDTPGSSAFIQGRVCAVTQGATTQTCAFPSPVTPGNTLYIGYIAACGLGCVGNSFTIADTNTNSYTQLVNGDGSSSTPPVSTWWAQAAGGTGTNTVTITLAVAPYGGFVWVEELKGIQPASSDGTNHSGSVTSGPPTFTAITTSHDPDIVIGTQFTLGATCTILAGSGYTIYNAGAMDDMSATHYQLVNEMTNATPPGSFTPTITNTCGGTPAGGTITQAFKTTVSTGFSTPFWGNDTLLDWAQEGLIDSPSGNAGKCAVLGADEQHFDYTTCGSSGGFVTSSGSPVAGNIAKFTTATNIAPAAYTDIVALWASGSCSGNLKSDGTCSTSSGTVNSAAQYLMPFYSAAGTASTLSGATGISTDSSQNNLTLVGGITTGSGTGAAGFYDFINGTSHTPTANSFSLFAPATISTGFGWSLPSAENSAQAIPVLGAASSHVSPMTFISATGTKCYPYMGSGGVGCDSGGGSSKPTYVSVFPGVPSASAYSLQAGFTSTIPANFTTPTTVCTCGTNPASSEVFTLTDGGSTVGTITLNSSCSATLATTGGTTFSISANDRLKMTSTTTDASGADYICSIPTT